MPYTFPIKKNKKIIGYNLHSFQKNRITGETDVCKIVYSSQYIDDVIKALNDYIEEVYTFMSNLYKINSVVKKQKKYSGYVYTKTTCFSFVIEAEYSDI